MPRSLALLCALAVAVVPLAAQAGPRENHQENLRKETRAGNVMPLRIIEQRVLRTMAGAQYLGPEYDAAAMVYRLKFIRDGRVIFVDVDARSGAFLNSSR
jgi:hypothetical protein